ncbi:hypothetical protein [Mesobacillus harenae]|nr:hypothetical protein [Mesobacillus harenae]
MAKNNQNESLIEFKRGNMEEEKRNRNSMKDQQHMPDQQNRLKDQENLRK